MGTATIRKVAFKTDSKTGLPVGEMRVHYDGGVTEYFPDRAAMQERVGDALSDDMARRIALGNLLSQSTEGLVKAAAQVQGKIFSTTADQTERKAVADEL
jgi:hypothetical protein